MTITAFEPGKFYLYNPGPAEAVSVKVDLIQIKGQPAKSLVAENKIAGDLWTITGTEDLTKWTEIPEKDYDSFGG